MGEVTLNRDLEAADIPLFSYVGISHTPKNSPYNEYPYAMARLRWFTDSFDPRLEEETSLSGLRSKLQNESKLNGHFTYLQGGDADAVDRILDDLFANLTGGLERHARDLGPHEPGIGEWVNEGDFTQRYWLEFPYGVDRHDLFGKVGDLVRMANPAVSGIYLYPPDYAGGPDGLVRHAFRVFAKSETGTRIDPELTALLS
ncbi:MAG: hypothetical protein ACSLFD_09935 [Solirubrobacterales bacterium]